MRPGPEWFEQNSSRNQGVDASQSAAILRRLTIHLRGGKPLPEGEKAFLASCFETYLDSQGESQLDKVLGLKTWGGVSAARADALALRNEMLTSLWLTLPDWSCLAPPAAARMMKLNAQRYEASRWPRECKQIDAPSSEPASTWWAILQSGLIVPDVRRLQKILIEGAGSRVLIANGTSE